MAGYSQPYHAEVEAHRNTKRRLIISNDVIASFREFLEAKELHRDFVEFMLVRCVGKNRAAEIMNSDSSLTPEKK